MSSTGVHVKDYGQLLSAEAQVQTSSKALYKEKYGTKIHRPQFLSQSGQPAPDKNACALNQDADIIELDITPPTSPISLASNLTSRMEEVLAEHSVESSSTSMRSPTPYMIRSLNLVPATEHRKQSNCLFNEGSNNTVQSNLNKDTNTIANELSEDGVQKTVR